MENSAEFYFRPVAREAYHRDVRTRSIGQRISWSMGFSEPSSKEAILQAQQAFLCPCDVCHKLLCGWSQMKSSCRARLVPVRN